MIRSVTRRSSEWTPDDRALILGYLDYDSLICQGCGGYLPETTDYENAGRYIAEPPHQCYRCTAVHKEQDEYKDSKNSRDLVTWPVHLKEKRHGG